MNISEALEFTKTRLETAGIESAGAETITMLSGLLNMSRTELLLARGRFLTLVQERTLYEWLERRAEREPLQHILGHAHFYGLELLVTPHALIPRPETERLVELGLGALRSLSKPKVLDIGTGSGAVALALKHERPDVVIVATDISLEALGVARENADRLSLDVELQHSNLLENADVAAFAREADLLLSNPPYLPEGDRDSIAPEVQADPPDALFSGEDGLHHFRRLEHSAHELLKPGAVMVVELDPRNVAVAFDEARGWRVKRLETDLTERERFLWLER